MDVQFTTRRQCIFMFNGKKYKSLCTIWCGVSRWRMIEILQYLVRSNCTNFEDVHLKNKGHVWDWSISLFAKDVEELAMQGGLMHVFNAVSVHPWINNSLSMPTRFKFKELFLVIFLQHTSIYRFMREFSFLNARDGVGFLPTYSDDGKRVWVRRDR